MNDGYFESQCLFEARSGLRRQPNLRNNNERLTPLSDDSLYAVNINLGFTTTGHALKHMTLKVVQVRTELLAHVSLLVCEFYLVRLAQAREVRCGGFTGQT